MERERDDFDPNAFLHPAQAFAHPRDVVVDPDLTLNKKRSILASWASDARAVDSQPALRQVNGGKTILFDEILEALRDLDRQAQAAPVRGSNYHEVLRRQRMHKRGRWRLA